MSEEIENNVPAEPVAAAKPAVEEPAPKAPKKKGGVLGTVVAILAVVVIGIAGMCGIAVHDIAESGQVYDPNAANASKNAIAGDLSAGVAATVNGVPLGEADITAYVQSVREGMGLTDDAEWVAWMADSGLTAEAVRDQSIDYYAEMELLIQAAAKQEVVVEEAAIEEQIASIRAGFQSDEEFNQAMASAGLNEDTLRRNIKLQLLQEGIESKLTAAAPEAAKATAASEWLENFVQSAAIEKNPMPEGLPYDVAAK